MTQTPLWGAYLELILGKDSTRKRRQWIFAPPVPPGLATAAGMSRPVLNPVYWYREQRNPDHKSTWTPTHLDTPQKHGDLLKVIADAEMKGWIANPIVTCELHVLEMKEIAESGFKTPYRILNRVTRVAQHKHNYKI